LAGEGVMILKNMMKVMKMNDEDIENEDEEEENDEDDAEEEKQKTTQNQHGAKTPANDIPEIPPATSMVVFKEQIFNISKLSLLNSSYALQKNLVLLDKIIYFIERSTPLLDPEYRQGAWHIEGELYHLKTMISNQHIYTTDVIRKEINEIIYYTIEHL